jgi:hypothetical protein
MMGPEPIIRIFFRSFLFGMGWRYSHSMVLGGLELMS